MDHINKVLEKIVVLLLVVLTGAVFMQVLSRTFRFSLSWIEELVRYLLIWMAIWGSALVIYRSSLIHMDVLLKVVPKTVKLILTELGSLLSAVFTLVVIYGSFEYIELGMGQISPALQIDMGYVYLIIPTGFGIMFLNILAAAFKRWGGTV